MNPFEQNQNTLRRRNQNEGAELNQEAKEKQVEEAEKKMAAKERVEMVGREVKSTKQQIQNITANMTQVLKAVAAIRAQLTIPHSDDTVPSVARDKKNLEELRKKLDGLMGEIVDLKGALLGEEAKSVKEENPGWNGEAVMSEAKRRVSEVLEKLEIGN